LIGEIGEFIASKILSGSVLAPGTSQAGWDLEFAGKKVQVKSHAKSNSNPYACTDVKNIELFDILVVVVMDQSFRVKVIYQINSIDIPKAGIKEGDRNIYRIPWKNLEQNHKVEIPDQLHSIRRKEGSIPKHGDKGAGAQIATSVIHLIPPIPSATCEILKRGGLPQYFSPVAWLPGNASNTIGTTQNQKNRYLHKRRYVFEIHKSPTKLKISLVTIPKDKDINKMRALGKKWNLPKCSNRGRKGADTIALFCWNVNTHSSIDDLCDPDYLHTWLIQWLLENLNIEEDEGFIQEAGVQIFKNSCHGSVKD
jgi:hypothetical protein